MERAVQVTAWFYKNIDIQFEEDEHLSQFEVCFRLIKTLILILYVLLELIKISVTFLF